jgi:rfaE bifunctional protein nucleotidyltransferase chain/domain
MGQVVLDQDDLAKRLKNLKVGGKRVVLTNGCFDLIHVGHVRCLLDAANRGDCLVVALNSDASVRALKGPGRPFQPQAERAELIAAIEGVNYVTIFDEETVGPLLRRLRPSVLAKGTDYTVENLPEREVLAEIGAELVVVGDKKSHSTRDLMRRVHSAYVAAHPKPKTQVDGKAAGARLSKGAARVAVKGGGRLARVTRSAAAAAIAKRRGKVAASQAHA